MVLYCAREGSKQRFVPTGVAAGGNEIKQRRNFSDKHFSGVAPCGFCLDGHDGNAVWDQPSQCMLPGSGISESDFQMKQKGNVAETPRYPLIQVSLAAIRRQAYKVFLYERIMPAKTSLLFPLMKIEERQVIIMCRDTGDICMGLPMRQAVMFMNSNKSEGNIRKIIQENRRKCSMAGIALMHESIVNKGLDRDIDRDAVNMLISLLITGWYDTVVVENMTDITEDGTDLKEFMRDTANISVGFFELSTMQYHILRSGSLSPITLQ